MSTMSISMALTRSLLRVLPTTTESAETALRFAQERTAPAEIPDRLRRIARVEESTVDGRRVVRLSPRGRPGGAHLIYTHGGCYLYPITSVHWRLLGTLIRDSGVSVTVPLYGRAPDYTAEEAYPLLDRLYDEAVETHGARVFLGGDSAGGGLALGQAVRYRDTGRRAPAGVLLISPWLDVTMGNPQIARLAPLDHLLAPAGMAAAGAWWAGGLDPRSPLISPLLGDLHSLPPVAVFQGGRDILSADATLLAERIAAAGGDVRLEFHPGAFHVFVGAPWTPEARSALRHAAAFLAAPSAHP
jgi:monoterpene epsilon-lactone hydrolase